MANYKGHLVGAVVVNTAYVAGASLLPGDILAETGGLFSNWQFVAFLYFVAMLFGLWPDIDTNSKGQDIFFTAGFILNLVLIWNGYLEASAYLGLLAMTPIVGKHRGWTHSIWAMLLVPSSIMLVSFLYRDEIFPATIIIYGAAVAGYFSHLLLDGLIIKKFRIKT
jgi:membrane-bound metal-dependent hydrolase YbcI (DUF457 family)